MFRTALVLASLALLPVAPATALASAPAVELPDGYLLDSVKLELKAFQTLLEANQRALGTSGEAMSEQAMKAHRESAALAAEARKLAATGEHAEAYRKLRDAWDARAVANEEFIARADAPTLRRVGSRYLDVVDARMEEMQAKGSPVDPAVVEEARQLRDQAQEAADGGDYERGLRLSLEALERLDRAIVASFGEGEG